MARPERFELPTLRFEASPLHYAEAPLSTRCLTIQCLAFKHICCCDPKYAKVLFAVVTQWSLNHAYIEAKARRDQVHWLLGQR